MREKLERDRLVLLVEQIRQADGTEEEIDQWLDLVDHSVPSVPAPTGYVSDLIFWPNDYGYTEEPSSSEIVDKALSYKPICL